MIDPELITVLKGIKAELEALFWMIVAFIMIYSAASAFRTGALHKIVDAIKEKK